MCLRSEANSHRSNEIARFYLKQIDAIPSARGRERERERKDANKKSKMARR